MSKLVVALIGAVAGLLLIYFGANFHIGQWFISGNEAYIPSAIGCAVAALFVQHMLRRQ